MHGRAWRLPLQSGIVSVALLLSFAGPMWSANGVFAQLVATRVRTAPVMDGKLDAYAWSMASETGNFVRLGSSNAPAKAQTYVKVIADDSALYVGFRCEEPRLSDVRAARGPQDGGILSQESVEVVLDPNGDGTTFYHLIANIYAEKYTAQLTTFLTGAPKEDTTWNGDWEARTSRGQKEWLAEFRIPFSTIGADLRKNSHFLINFSRSRHIEIENSSWSATRVSFVEPANVGELIVPHDDGSYFLLQFPKLDSIVAGYQNVPFRIVNRTTTHVHPKLTYTMRGHEISTGSVQLKAVAAGRDLEASLPIATNELGHCKLAVDVVDSVTGKKLCSLARETEVTQPIVFNEALYALYQRRADAVIDVRVPSENAKLRVSLLKAGGETPLAVKTIRPPFVGDVKVSFSLAGKDKGTYRIRAELVRGEKVLVRSYSRSYSYNPSPKIGFDRNGIILVDQKPFFPIGIYNLRTRLGTPDDKVGEITEEIMAEAAQAGFNTTVLYDYETPNLLPLLDSCERHGIKAVVYPTIPFHKRKGDETLDTVRGDMKARMSHPAVLGWYVVDEPEGIGTAPSQAVRDLYQTIKEYDSDHPSAIVVMGAVAAGEYRSATDIMCADPYPLPDLPVTLVSDVVSGCVRNIESDKPMWCIVQAFDWNAYEGKFNGVHRPTPEEERCMTYLALANGAKGVIYWAHTAGKYYINDYPQHWAGLKKIAGELRDLSPVLVTPTVTGKLAVSPRGGAIQTMLKQDNGHWYALTVNSSGKPIEANFFLPDTPDGSNVEVLFEGRTISAEKDGWKDSFKPSEVHVYKVSVHGSD